MMEKFKEKSTVCFLGDSIVADGKFMRRIYDFYLKKGIRFEMYNCGVPGDKCEGGLCRLEETVMCHKPTDVIVSFGMNDIKRELYTGSVDAKVVSEKQEMMDRSVAALGSIISELKKRNVRVSVMTPTPYDALTTSEQTALIGADAALRELSDWFLATASQLSVCAVDMNKKFNEYLKNTNKAGFQIIKDDRVHPNEYGHELMTQIFLKEQGFDIEITEDKDVLGQRIAKGFSDWEDERYKIEQSFKKMDYVEWNACAEFKGNHALNVKKINAEIDSVTRPYILECYRAYLTQYDEMAEARQKIEEYTKTVYNQSFL